jgi:hypothetical protein
MDSALGMMALAAKHTSAIRKAMSSASLVPGSAMNENWNIGVREHSGADARFAQACKALPLHHLYFLNN